MHTVSNYNNEAVGIFHCKAINRDGVVVQEITEHNTIVDTHKTILAHAIADQSATPEAFCITKLGVGYSNENGADSTVAALTAQSSPVVPVTYVNLDEATVLPDGTSIKFEWTLGYDDANGLSIGEFGLFSNEGVLFSRKIRTSKINKENDLQLVGEWTIIF